MCIGLLAAGPTLIDSCPVTTVISPGSSANLGPGFDVLGVALNRHVWASDEPSCGGRGGERCWDDHVARIAFEQAGGSGDLYFGFDLIPGRGLGFSAAARAAGAVLARLRAGDDLDAARAAAYEVVNELEGHGDNAAPSVFGGTFVIAGDLAHRLAVDPPGNFLCWVPEAVTPTDESRACLTPEVPRADAVFNLGRVGLLVAAFYEQDPSLLRRATEDRLHQPPRLAAQPASAEALRVGLEAGAHAGWLSGSGPTVALLVPDDRVDDVSSALSGAGQVLRLDVDRLGSVVC